MIYYLKVNRVLEYTYRNIQHWMEIISNDKDTPQCYIICDKRELEKEIINRVNFCGVKTFFIKSTRRPDAVSIAKNTCDKYWWPAACAHLTTFFHAEDKGYDEFWNIDADDTCLCLDSARGYQLLEEARKQAKEDKYEIFSLDMWVSSTLEFEKKLIWSFGVTYTCSPNRWIEVMKKYEEEKDIIDEFRVHNLDIYFSYLLHVKSERIGTFYFDNLKFIHFSDDFIAKPFSSGIFHWHDGQLMFPIIYDVFGNEQRGKARIAPGVIKIDIQINDDEAGLFLTNNYAAEKLYP